jgi:hypothetical protein
LLGEQQKDRGGISYVRANRVSSLPLTAEYGVVSACSDLRQQYSACTDYSHPDHRAVQEAVHNTDLIPDAGRIRNGTTPVAARPGPSASIPNPFPVAAGAQTPSAPRTTPPT